MLPILFPSMVQLFSQNTFLIKTVKKLKCCSILCVHTFLLVLNGVLNWWIWNKIVRSFSRLPNDFSLNFCFCYFFIPWRILGVLFMCFIQDVTYESNYFYIVSKVYWKQDKFKNECVFYTSFIFNIMAVRDRKECLYFVLSCASTDFSIQCI